MNTVSDKSGSIIKNPLKVSNLKAVIFDVDGTLYNQTLLRILICYDLIKFAVFNPSRLRDLKIIWDFRKSREKNHLNKCTNINKQQYIWGSETSGVSQEQVYQIINRWIYEEPLKYLAKCMYNDVHDFFSFLEKKKILIGVYSDYPAVKKLKAMRLNSNVIVCSTDKEVDRLKPDPKGLIVTAQKLQVPVENCLFIGDSDEKDGECARNARMKYLIVHKKDKNLPFCFQTFSKIKTWIIETMNY